MADGINVTITPQTLQALPDGDAVEAVITVQNAGTTVDQYAVELDGLPTTWYSLSNASVALFPQDKDEARLVIRPPKGNGAKAGTYPFTVTVLSRADSSRTSRAEGTLQVGTVGAFDVDMSPKKVIGRKGRYVITVRNGGNADVDVALEATDAEGGCRYRFKPEETNLQAGQQVRIPLEVRPRRSGFVGPRKQYDFQVKVKPNKGETKVIAGQIVHQPRLRTWKPIRRLIMLLVVLGALLAAFTVLGGRQGVAGDASRLQSLIGSSTCKRFNLFCPTAQAHGHYISAFKDFHTHDPQLIGDPLGDEHISQGRFATQDTSTGLLIYDPQDNFAFFVRHDGAVYEFDHGVERQVKQAP